MENLIIEIMNNYGYIGIFLLIMIENVFPPIPSEVILTFGGFMTINSDITVLGVILASTLGSLLGAFILYFIGKFGKLLRIKPKDIESADKWFDEKGNKTVFFCRFVPVVRSLISIPAGMSDMPIIKFVIYTILGSFVWNTALVFVGAFAGDKKDLILSVIDKASYIILFIIITICILIIFKKYIKENNRKK